MRGESINMAKSDEENFDVIRQFLYGRDFKTTHFPFDAAANINLPIVGRHFDSIVIDSLDHIKTETGRMSSKQLENKVEATQYLVPGENEVTKGWRANQDISGMLNTVTKAMSHGHRTDIDNMTKRIKELENEKKVQLQEISRLQRANSLASYENMILKLDLSQTNEILELLLEDIGS
jgi:hypothetical protein